MALGRGGAPEEGGWGLAAEAIAVMGALMVVEAQERVEAALQGRPTGEIAPAEGHAPVLLQDRALQALDEAIGPGMPWFRARVAQTESVAHRIEGAMEFGPPVGQHPAQPPAGPAIVRQEDRPQKLAAASAVCAGKSCGSGSWGASV